MIKELHDLADIAAKLAQTDSGMEKDLILIAGLPGVGKTTLARELVERTRAIHFEIDEVKRLVVPEDIVTQEIDPPEYRYKYYAATIRRLPELFARSSTQVVIIDETFHLEEFREMWNQAATELDIRLHWIEAVCREATVKERLCLGKDRECHILGDEAFPMYLLFKKMYEPMQTAHEVVDTGRDIVPQVEKIVGKLPLLK